MLLSNSQLLLTNSRFFMLLAPHMIQDTKYLILVDPKKRNNIKKQEGGKQNVKTKEYERRERNAPRESKAQEKIKKEKTDAEKPDTQSIGGKTEKISPPETVEVK